MRRSILLLALTLLVNTSLLAQSELQSGTIGDGGISWILTDDYVLTINGDGVISDYSSASSVPWYNYRTQITTVKLTGYITSIGKYTFYNHTALTSIYCVNTTPATLMSNTFSSSQLTQITAYVPEDAMSLYQSEQYWSQMTIAANPDLTTGGTSEAYLSGIYLDGVVLDGFDPMIFSYQVSLPSGTTNYPNVTYTLNDESLQVTVDQPSSDNPQAILTVTTSDGSLTNTYAVAFTIENSDTTTLTGYGILINSDRVVTTEEAGTDTNGRQQYLAHAQLNAYDTVRIIDLTNNNATWMVELDAASVSGFEGSASLGYLVCTVAGCYDCYIKLKYEDDQLYIGAGTDGCSEGVYYPINNGTGTTTTAAYYLIGNTEELGAWSLADAKPLSQTNDTTIILAPGTYSFKVLPQNTSWDGAMGFSALNTGCADNIATDVDDNIVITLEEEGSVYVQCDGQMVCVSGNLASTSSTVHFTATATPEEAGYVSYTDQDFPRGTTIELTASISTGGWMFDRWSDNDSWDNPRSIYLDKDTTITAIFSPGEYGIQVNGSEVIEGTYTGRVSDGSYIGQFLVTTNLQAGDQIQIINLFHGDNSTWRPELEDGGVSGNFTTGDSELICNTAGCYTIYIKIAYGQSSDYVYIANGDGCSNGEYIYSLVGSSALFGSEWNESDSTTEMTLQAESGMYTYTLDSVSLIADTTYEYKVISNHAWNVREYPSISENYQLIVEQAGVYSILFTLDPNSGCTTSLTYLHEIIDAQTCEPQSGTCGADGDNVTWQITCDSIMYIRGTGAMADYSGSSSVPWHDYQTVIRHAVIVEGVTSLSSSSTFENCTAMESVTIPEGITSLGDFTFSDCSSLRAVDMPSTMTSCGSYCFSNCAYIDSIICRAATPPTANGSTFTGVNYMIPIYVPAGTTELYQSADGWSSFTDFRELTSCVTISGECGAEGENLTWSLTCDSVLTISGTGAMANYQNDADVPWYEHRAAILSVIINEGVESIAGYAFLQCTNLTSATIPSTVNAIGGMAFGHCLNLSSVNIPEGVTYIQGYTFTNCSSLSSIEIPASVTRIANEAFSGCTSLGNIYCRGAYPPEDDLQNAFTGIDSTIVTVFVPSRSVSLYQSADGWKNFSNIRAQDDPSKFTMPVSTEWQFIMLPSMNGDEWCGLPADSILCDSTLVWGRYIGAYRAQGQSGWQLFDPNEGSNEGRFLCTDAYIVRANGQGATFTMKVPDKAANMESVTYTYSKYTARHAENANWNFVGNPYPYYYNILAQLDALGITTPITVWNGTGYETLTPGIDTERMLAPFEPFFIQVPEDVESIIITFSGEYIVM